MVAYSSHNGFDGEKYKSDNGSSSGGAPQAVAGWSHAGRAVYRISKPAPARPARTGK